MTPRQSKMWDARCHLGHYYSVIATPSVSRCAISVMMIALHRANMRPNTPAEQRLLRMHRKRSVSNCRETSNQGVINYSFV